MNLDAPKADGGASILLVDDNRHGLVARKALLEEQGYRIATANDGEEALKLFRSLRPQVVVTDYRMPNMDGGELIRQIKNTDPATAVILLSGFVDILGLTEQSTGADVVIAKSASEVPKLLRAVDRVLNRRPQRKPAARQHGAAARPRSKLR
jgi:CheY-like chemotaxis protein